MGDELCESAHNPPTSVRTEASSRQSFEIRTVTQEAIAPFNHRHQSLRVDFLLSAPVGMLKVHDSSWLPTRTRTRYTPPSRLPRRPHTYLALHAPSKSERPVPKRPGTGTSRNSRKDARNALLAVNALPALPVTATPSARVFVPTIYRP